MTSFPHNLVLDIQARFGLAQSTFLNLYNILINWRIFMKIDAKCLACVSLSYQVHVKVCYPFPKEWLWERNLQRLMQRCFNGSGIS